MVKRVIAIIAGALAGMVLWFMVGAPLLAPSHADSQSEGCKRDDAVECALYDDAAPAQLAAPLAVADACKGWLSNGALTSLSQCLHDARRTPDAALAARVDALHRQQAIAKSS
jgi:hypothetical protein